MLSKITIVVSAFVVACSTAHVAPIGAGRTELGVDYGGVVTKLKGVVMPAPVLTPKIAYGLSADVDAVANLPLTPLLFGLLAVDAKAVFFPLKMNGVLPGIGFSAGALTLTSVRPGHVDRRPLFLPETGSSAAWRVSAASIAYVGIDARWRTESMRFYDEAPNYDWSPFLGFGWAPSPQSRWTLELKKFVANWRSDQVAADLYSFDGHSGFATHHPQNGAVGMLVGYQWTE